MKKLLIVLELVALSLFCCAEDLYLTPDRATSPVSFKAKGQTFRIWGLKPGKWTWDEISQNALGKMLRGKRFKFVVRKEAPEVARFGIYGKDGNPQPNIAIVMLEMGLAQYNPADLLHEEKMHNPYRSAEEEAKKAGLGIWSR